MLLLLAKENNKIYLTWKNVKANKLTLGGLFCFVSLFTILLLKVSIEFFFFCHSRMRQIPVARPIPYPVLIHLKFKHGGSLE